MHKFITSYIEAFWKASGHFYKVDSLELNSLANMRNVEEWPFSLFETLDNIRVVFHQNAMATNERNHFSAQTFEKSSQNCGMVPS